MSYQDLSETEAAYMLSLLGFTIVDKDGNEVSEEDLRKAMEEENASS